MNVMVRGYGNGKLVFEEKVDTNSEHLEDLVVRQIKRVQDFAKNMLEIEFIEEAPKPDRFFRFGTDPSGMVLPIGFKWKVTKKRRCRPKKR